MRKIDRFLVPFLIFSTGLLIGFIGLAIFRIIPTSFVLGQLRLNEFIQNTNLASASEGISSMGALIVGVPVSIGASIATIYVAHRAAKAEEQLEKIERLRDQRDLEEFIKERYNNVAIPYHDLAKALSEFDSAAHSLTVIFIRSVPKLYGFCHSSEWEETNVKSILIRNFIEINNRGEKIIIDFPEEVDNALDLILNKIKNLIDKIQILSSICYEEKLSKLDFIKKFESLLEKNIESCNGKISDYSKKEIFYFKNELWTNISYLILAQTSKISVFSKLDSYVTRYIFNEKTVLPIKDSDVSFILETNEKKNSWVPYFGVIDAAKNWNHDKFSILGGILWTSWEPKEIPFPFRTEEQKKLDAIIYYNDFFKYNEEDFYEGLDNDENIDDHHEGEFLYEDERASYLVGREAEKFKYLQTLSNSTFSGLPIGSCVLNALANCIPSKDDICEYLTNEFKNIKDLNLDKNEKTIEFIRKSTSTCADVSLYSSVDYWKRTGEIQGVNPFYRLDENYGIIVEKDKND